MSNEDWNELDESYRSALSGALETAHPAVEQVGGDERAVDGKPRATKCPDCGEGDLMPGDLCACGYETDPSAGYACSECDGSGDGCVGEVCRECDGTGWFVTPEQARATLAQPSPTLPPFAEKVLAKLRRFNECAEDSDSGGVDIGRHWLDLLTQLGLLNRVQRSPALWEISQQGEDLLGLDVPEIEVPDSMIEKAWQRFERTLQQLETPGQAEQAEQAEAERPEGPTEDELEAAGLGYPLHKEEAVKLWYSGFRSEVITVLEAWEAIGHDTGINPDKEELLDSLRYMLEKCEAHDAALAEVERIKTISDNYYVLCVERQQQLDAALARVEQQERTIAGMNEAHAKLAGLYEAAQAQHSVPEGWMRVPIEPLLNMMSDKDHDTRITAERQLLSILAAAPGKEGV
ncbi:hypothetical protein [Pseudomonas aeruginosa]|uniref:hypothetical protein n=1 Tax=Pseudomonas aeruginosa TaxID=287 RepID=UPI0039833E9F